MPIRLTESQRKALDKFLENQRLQKMLAEYEGEGAQPETKGASSVWQAITQPLGVAKGLAVNTPINVLSGIGEQLANITQAVSPVAIPGASDPVVEGFNPIQRGARVMNAALFGIPETIARRKEETYAQKGQPQNFEDVFDAWAGALTETAVQDILPGREISALVTGKTPEGEPLTGEDVGELIGGGLLKAAPLAKGLGKVTRKLTGSGKPTLPRYTGRIRSAGEIKAATDISEFLDDAQAAGATLDDALATFVDMQEGKRGSRTPQNWMLNDEQLNHFVQKGLLDAPVLRQAVNEAKFSPQFFEAIEKLPLVRGNKYVGEAIRRGALSAESLAKLSEKYDIPIEQVPAIVGEVVERSATVGGKTLNAFSRVLSSVEENLALRLLEGDKSALSQYNSILKLQKGIRGETPTTAWGKFVHFANKGVESARRSFLVGQLVTAVRNMAVQGGNIGIAALEDALANTFEATAGRAGQLMRGVPKNARKPLGEYYHDLQHDFGAFVHNFKPKERAQFRELTKLYPEVYKQLNGSWSYELGGELISNIAKWRRFGLKPAKAAEWMDLTKEVVTTMTRVQEREFRNYFFQARLQSWMDRLDIPSVERLTELSRAPKLRPEVRAALADSVDYALKQTFAWTPESGLGAAILNVYDKVPFATAIGPTFPRFWINSINWQLERAPTIWFNMFNKDFRKQLMDGANSGFQSRAASLALAKATSGLGLLNAAFYLREMQEPADLGIVHGSPGAKYYQWHSKDKDGKEVIQDLRPFQPLVSYMFLAEWIRAQAAGKHMNLTANEWTDALVGIRRLSEVQIFAFPEEVRAVAGTDKDAAWKAVKTPAGQYLASWFVPLRQFIDFYGQADKDWRTYKDTRGQELTGPVRANIPFLAETLPQRVSPWTGEPMESIDPAIRQITGIGETHQTPLQQFVQTIPGIQQSDLTGVYSTPRANALVAKYMGQMLNEGSEGDRLSDFILNEIKDTTSNTLAQKELLQKAFAPLRAAARAEAESEDPSAFMEDYIRSQPASEREAVRRELLELGLIK